VPLSGGGSRSSELDLQEGPARPAQSKEGPEGRPLANYWERAKFSRLGYEEEKGPATKDFWPSLKGNAKGTGEEAP